MSDVNGVSNKPRLGRPPLNIPSVTRSVRIRKELDDYITKMHEETRLSKTELVNDALECWMNACERGELYGR